MFDGSFKTVRSRCCYNFIDLITAVMTKNELLEGLELLYTGKGFKGFREDNPYVIFLKFDRTRWSKIWVKYGRRAMMTSLKNVRLQRDLTVRF